MLVEVFDIEGLNDRLEFFLRPEVHLVLHFLNVADGLGGVLIHEAEYNGSLKDA